MFTFALIAIFGVLIGAVSATIYYERLIRKGTATRIAKTTEMLEKRWAEGYKAGTFTGMTMTKEERIEFLKDYAQTYNQL